MNLLVLSTLLELIAICIIHVISPDALQKMKWLGYLFATQGTICVGVYVIGVICYAIEEIIKTIKELKS
jgi:uncharacterized membrane protein